MQDRVVTVLFIFPGSREIRHMREPPRLGSRVRSPRGAVWTVAQVLDNGSDTYTATCVGTSRVVTVPHRAANPMSEADSKESQTATSRILLPTLQNPPRARCPGDRHDVARLRVFLSPDRGILVECLTPWFSLGSCSCFPTQANFGICANPPSSAAAFAAKGETSGWSG